MCPWRRWRRGPPCAANVNFEPKNDEKDSGLQKMHILFRQNPGISELCNGFMNDVQSTNIISDISVASP